MVSLRMHDMGSEKGRICRVKSGREPGSSSMTMHLPAQESERWAAAAAAAGADRRQARGRPGPAAHNDAPVLAEREARVRLHNVGAVEAGAARQEGEQLRLLHPDALHPGARDLERDALPGLGVREGVLGLDDLRKGAHTNEAPEAVAPAEEPAPVPVERAAVAPRQHQEPVVVVLGARVVAAAAARGAPAAEAPQRGPRRARRAARARDDILEPGRERGHHRQRPPERRAPAVRALDKRRKRRAVRFPHRRARAAPPPGGRHGGREGRERSS